MDHLPPDYVVKVQQFTPTIHRDIYPAVIPTQPSLSQNSKVVIVTGASRGVGALGFVPAFAAAGAKAIVLVARDAAKLKEVAEKTAKEYPNIETLVVPTDLTNPESVSSLFEQVKEKYGHADVLINNAAIFEAVAPVKEVDQQAWWDEITLNVRGTFLATQSFLSLLPTPTTPAKIISLTTAAAFATYSSISAYSMSKMAVCQLTDYVAVENPNVLAVALNPGILDTDMVKDMFRRFGWDTPALAGAVAVWLSAWGEREDRSFLSGRFVSVNWDVEELVERKSEILEKGLLKMSIVGQLGAEQFGQ